MKGEFDECSSRDLCSRHRRKEPRQGKINTLLSDLLEKEQEIVVYRDRLKELESAFCYNLEVIAERDLEITLLEKQLHSEVEKERAIARERDELEELVKVIDEKKGRKIQQLETKLALKQDEISDLQKDQISNINALKRVIDNIKAQQEEKMCKLNNEYDLHKKELLKSFQKELEEKDKNYLLEIRQLKGELEQARRENEELANIENECRNLKSHLENVEKLFQEKEVYYLEEIRKIMNSSKIRAPREVQREIKIQRFDKNVQTEADKTAAEGQRVLTEVEEEYKKKVSFLQEQNEVLKCVIKDMKKNRSESRAEESSSGCDCTAVGLVERVNKKFESEITNIKKILEEERRQRREEEAAIQSLESSILCLKDKFIMELQEKLERISEIDEYRVNPESRNEIQVNLLEDKLTKKIDIFMTRSRQEQQKLYKKLEEIKKECIDKMENYLKPKEETKNDNLLEEIRLDIQKLENKIERDVKDIITNNLDKKYEKNHQSKEDIETNEMPDLYTKSLQNNTFDSRSIGGFYSESEQHIGTSKVKNKGKNKSECKKSKNDLAVR